MSDYDELDDELDELDETLVTSHPEAEEDMKEAQAEKAETVISEAGGKLGESDEDFYRKKEAEAEAKGEYTYADQYKEQADAEAIYDEIKD